MQLRRWGWCPHCQQGHQSCCLLLAHPSLIGGHVTNSGSGNASTSTSTSVCVCVRVRVGVHACVCVLRMYFTLIVSVVFVCVCCFFSCVYYIAM